MFQADPTWIWKVMPAFSLRKLLTQLTGMLSNPFQELEKSDQEMLKWCRLTTLNWWQCVFFFLKKQSCQDSFKPKK